MQERNKNFPKVLITGATGNVGTELIRKLSGKGLQIVAGVRNPADHHQALDFQGVQPVIFDFADPACFANALTGVSVLFLLRPPQLADVSRYFAPLIDAAKKLNVAHLVFLSVQGADRNRFIPHYKIEQLIKESSIPFTFLRPAYFMQNFTTTLRADIQHRQRVYLPAGKARFTLVDLRDVGAVAASIILNPAAHSNKAYDLTSADQLDFASMTRILSMASGQPIAFESPNLLSFYIQKRKEGLSPTLIGVLIMLHYLPRFKKPPATSNAVKEILGREPVSFAQFARDHATMFFPKKDALSHF